MSRDSHPSLRIKQTHGNKVWRRKKSLFPYKKLTNIISCGQVQSLLSWCCFFTTVIKSKPLQCRVGMACGNSCSFSIASEVTFRLTLAAGLRCCYRGDFMKGRTWTYPWEFTFEPPSLRSCSMDLEEYFIFLYFASFCSLACWVLFRSQQLHDLFFVRF